MQKAWFPTNAQGFSAVELLLAVSIFGVLVVSVMGGLLYSQTSSAAAGDRARATMLAEEGLEAVRNIRDASFDNLTDGTHGLAKSGGVWVLSGTQDVTGVYTRQVTISSPGTNVNVKTVTSRVTWSRGAQGTGDVEVSTQMTWWFNDLAKSWDKAYLKYTTDLSGSNAGVKVATAGDYAYLVRADGSPDFVVLNISNSAAPTEAASLALDGEPTNIFVSGGYAYVTSTNDTSELQVLDITTPLSPLVIGSYDAAGTADGKGVYVTGSTAYLARAANGSNDELVILDVTVPTVPSLLGALDYNSDIHELHVSGTYAYLATGNDSQEVTVVDVTSSATPAVAGTLDLTGTADAITVAGYSNRLLVGQGTSFHVINVATPASPAALGSVTLSGNAKDITKHDTASLAMVGTDAASDEFQVISLTTESSPSVLKTVNATGSIAINGVAYSGSLDVVIGASSDAAREVLMFSPN